MNTAQVNILADDQNQAEAIAIAVNNGLANAGFSNVTLTSQVEAEQSSFLDSVRGQFPDLFAAPVEVSYSVLERAEAEVAADEPATEEAAETVEA
jgi:hypothetical protein